MGRHETVRTPQLGERIALYACLTALTAFSIDAMLPGLPLIETALAPSPPLSTQHVISLFIFGMALGELVLGPLSDATGRKPALLAGLALYGLGTLLAVSAGSLETLVCARVLQGIGVAGPKIATRAMIRDQFAGAQMARILSLIFTLFILVPLLAPWLGQTIMMAFGWRSLFVLSLALSLMLGLWLALRHPETLDPASRLPLRPTLLLANGRSILGHRRVSSLIVATGLVFGAQLFFLSTAADLFAEVYGISEGLPLVLALFSAGLGLASFANARLVQRLGSEPITRRAFQGLGVTGLMMLIASFGPDGRPSLPPFLALGFAAFFCIGLLFGNLNALAMQPLGRLAGLGSSMVASGSSLIATLFGVALGAITRATPTVLAAAFTLAGIGGLLLLEAGRRDGSAPVEPIGEKPYRR